MRFVPTATILSLVGALVGCGSSTPSTPSADAGAATDVVTVTDTGNTTPTDTPTVTDAGGASAINAEVETLVREAAMNNWAIINRSRGMMMHGCTGATRPQDCLADLPAPSDADIGEGRSALPNAHLKVLLTSQGRSTY